MKGEQRFIITTEKDAVRLINSPYFPHRLKPYLFFLPIRVEFIDHHAASTSPVLAGRAARAERQNQGVNPAAEAFNSTLLRLLAQKSFLAVNPK